MTLYIDSSALAARHLANEAHHAEAVDLTKRDLEWLSSALTLVETERALRLGIAEDVIDETVAAFRNDCSHLTTFAVDDLTLSVALQVAVETGVKTLDAIQIATAALISDRDLTFLTFDDRQARAAADVGLRLAR